MVNRGRVQHEAAGQGLWLAVLDLERDGLDGHGVGLRRTYRVAGEFYTAQPGQVREGEIQGP
ncbi:hypothetical protein D3C76_1411420 [compost metagenome]